MFSFGNSDVNQQSDPVINHGPKQDSDWFKSNGTLQTFDDTLSAFSGLKSNNAMDRLISIGRLFAKFFGGD